MNLYLLKAQVRPGVLEMTTSILGGTLFLSTGTIAALFVEELPIPQQWTVLGLLAFVLVGVYLLLRGVGVGIVREIKQLAKEVRELPDRIAEKLKDNP